MISKTRTGLDTLSHPLESTDLGDANNWMRNAFGRLPYAEAGQHITSKWEGLLDVVERSSHKKVRPDVDPSFKMKVFESRPPQLPLSKEDAKQDALESDFFHTLRRTLTPKLPRELLGEMLDNLLELETVVGDPKGRLSGNQKL